MMLFISDRYVFSSNLNLLIVGIFFDLFCFFSLFLDYRTAASTLNDDFQMLEEDSDFY